VNWITNYVRPKIQAALGRRDTPENLWRKCDECGQMIFHHDLEAAQYVCPHCDHHMKIGPEGRFKALFDEGAYDEIPLPPVPSDPLRFRDEKRYSDRLRDARAKTGQEDAVRVAVGALDGLTTVVAVQNFAFLGGSMGMAAGEALITAAETALARQAPLVVFAAAGGARMQEGILSLMQMPRTVIAVEMLREARLPYIVVLTDPTTGGVTASFAMLGDVQLAEPKALIGFAGPRVIQQTIRETLPEGFQRAEYLLEHGMLDMVVHRYNLRETLSRLLHLLRDRPEPARAAGEDSEFAVEAQPAPPALDEAALAEQDGRGEADAARAEAGQGERMHQPPQPERQTS
jgi:acetyl-CoA carboxylase carboxyl transferase subunit beta